MYFSGRGARLAWQPALAVFAVGVLVTGTACWLLARAAEVERDRELDREVRSLHGQLDRLVSGHAALLASLRSLHAAEPGLSRLQFHNFVVGGKLLKEYPGAQALEFARRVKTSDVASFEASVRVDSSVEPAGYPQFSVHPSRETGDQWVVDYIEPMATNEAAFGLDLGAEASRRTAIEGACAGVRPVATGPVRLVQELGTSAGLVVVAPVYDGEGVPEWPRDRASSCTGLMLVVYRAADLIAGVQGSVDRVDYAVYDVGPAAFSDSSAPLRLEGLLYESRPGTPGGRAAETHSMELEFHGRRWRIVASRSGSLAFLTPARVVLAVGLPLAAGVALLVAQLAGSRRRDQARGRVVDASDRARRSLERDLHDGAQQRLLSVSLVLGQAEALVAGQSRPAALIAAAREDLARSLAELRELARGLHPAVVSDHGLVVAVQGAAGRSPVPVELHLDLDAGRRLPRSVEVAAYYVVCEALANTARHAAADLVVVSLRSGGGRLVVEVRDDGVGGARIERGTGLRGLVDRVEALDGRLSLSSAPGRGTWVRAEIPFE